MKTEFGLKQAEIRRLRYEGHICIYLKQHIYNDTLF